LIVGDSPSRAKREIVGRKNQVGFYDVTFINLRKIPNGSRFDNGLVVAISTGYRSAFPLATQNAKAKALCCYTIALLICVHNGANF